jgi:hypothetical protein
VIASRQKIMTLPPHGYGQAQDWECMKDERGVIRTVRAGGRPAKGLAFLP